LDKRKKAKSVLLESLKGFPWNWSAWIDYAGLCLDDRRLGNSDNSSEDTNSESDNNLKSQSVNPRSDRVHPNPLSGNGQVAGVAGLNTNSNSGIRDLTLDWDVEAASLKEVENASGRNRISSTMINGIKVIDIGDKHDMKISSKFPLPPELENHWMSQFFHALMSYETLEADRALAM
jgi:hypothetical protein